MFKRLKDKIAEEVKISPQRIQQLTQSVTERLQSPLSEDNFFSLGDDDSVASSTTLDGSNFTDVSLQSPTMTSNDVLGRRYSNSSMASDTSFLPRYEPNTNVYHINSDFDGSASEFEDNISTSSQLGRISKEQIHAAFQKAQLRYHKYRGRFTDLAKSYKQLEGENAKIRVVLVETQDKAIRRVNELKEQCVLEQKAKAHLENLLREELDEKQIKISTLETKVRLLQTCGVDGDKCVEADQLSSAQASPSSTHEKYGDNLETLMKDLNQARVEIENLNERNQELKANAIIYNSRELEVKQKLTDLEKALQEKTVQIDALTHTEKENNLNFAQIKMELHTELQNKDAEVENLKRSVETLKRDLDRYEKVQNGNGGNLIKIEKLTAQNSNLIEKNEMLNQKCQNYERELIKLEQCRIEIGDLRTINQKLVRDVSTLQEMTQTSEEKLKAESDKLMKVEREKEEVEVKMRNLEEDCNKMKNDYQEKVKQVMENLEGAELKEKITNLEDEVHSYRCKIKELEQLCEAMTKEKVEFEKTAVRCEESCKKLNDTNDELIAKIKTLQVENLHLNEDRKNSGDKVTTIEESLKELSFQKEAILQDLAKMREKVNELSEENNNLQIEIDKAENEIQDEQDRMVNIMEENKNLSIEIDDLNLTIKELMETNNGLQKEHERVKQDAKISLLGLESKIRNKLEAEYSEREKMLKADLESKLNDLVSSEKDVKVTELKLMEAVDEIKKYEGLVTDLQSKIKFMQEKYTELETNHLGLIKENDETESNLLLLQKECVNFEDKVNALEHETSSLHDENKKLRSEVANLKDSNTKLLDDLSNSSNIEELEQKSAEIESLMSKVKSLELQVSNVHRDEEVLRNEISLLQVVSTKQQNENCSLIERNLILEDDMKKKTEQLLTNIEHVRSERDTLKNKLQTLHETYEGTKLIKEQNEVLQRTLEIERDEFKEKYQDAVQGKSCLEETICKLQKECDEISWVNDQLQAVKTDLVKEKTRLCLEIEEKDVSLRKLNERSDNAANQMEKLTCENENLHKENCILNEKIEDSNEIKQKYNVACTEAGKLKEQLSDMTQLRKQLEDLEVMHEELRKQKEILVGQNTRLKQDLLDIRVTNENVNLIKEENSRLSEEITRYQYQVQDAHNQVQQYKEQLTKLRAIEVENEDLKKNNNFLNKQINAIQEEKDDTNRKICTLSTDYEHILRENEDCLKKLTELEVKLEFVQKEKDVKNAENEQNEEVQRLRATLNELQDKLKVVEDENAKLDDELRKNATTDDDTNQVLKLQTMQLQEMASKYEALRIDYKNVVANLERLEDSLLTESYEKKEKSKQYHELEVHYGEVLHENQLLKDEIEELKISPLNLGKVKGTEHNEDEVDSLREKLEKYKLIDKANRSSIEFYDNELQRYKVKNEKLTRKLDETLVTLPVLSGTNDSLEAVAVLEYLRNVLYKYMTGKESLTLAKVIAAVCKFDERQTESILQREQQKQTLLGNLFGS